MGGGGERPRGCLRLWSVKEALMQQSRRTNPYPFTWEIPLTLAVTVLLLLVLGVQAGRAVANLAAGSGVSFPPRDALFTSVPGMLAGDAGAGLPRAHAGRAHRPRYAPGWPRPS